VKESDWVSGKPNKTYPKYKPFLLLDTGVTYRFALNWLPT